VELSKLACQIQEIRERKVALKAIVAYLEERIAHKEKMIASLEQEEQQKLRVAAKAVPRHVPMDTPEGTFQWSPSIKTEIDPEVVVKDLPERFITYKETYTPDKLELRRAIEAKEFSHPGIRVKETWRLKLK